MLPPLAELSLEEDFELAVLSSGVDNCDNIEELKEITKSLLRQSAFYRKQVENLVHTILLETTQDETTQNFGAIEFHFY